MRSEMVTHIEPAHQQRSPDAPLAQALRRDRPSSNAASISKSCICSHACAQRRLSGCLRAQRTKVR